MSVIFIHGGEINVIGFASLDRWVHFLGRIGEMEREPSFFTAVAGQRNLLPVIFLHYGVQQSQFDIDCLPVTVFFSYV